jgi:broad specificity phosphatase PhoE
MQTAVVDLTASSLPAATRLYLLRHGEVETRYHRVFGGRIDMDLSPRGHEQAQALAEYFRSVPLDAVYVSPMKRAQQTVAPLVAITGHTPTRMADLREVDFGDWTGLTWEQVRARFQINAFHWLDKLETASIPGAESVQQFRERLEPCLRTILCEHPGQSVAVVCHGGVIRVLLALLLDIPVVKFASFDVEYASVTRIAHRPDRTEVQLMNFTPWSAAGGQ